MTTPHAEYIDLTGYLYPWKGDAPLLIQPTINEEVWVPVFSSMEQLWDFCNKNSFTFETVGAITNDKQFMANCRANGLRVALNPVVLPNGESRFHEVHPCDN